MKRTEIIKVLDEQAVVDQFIVDSLFVMSNDKGLDEADCFLADAIDAEICSLIAQIEEHKQSQQATLTRLAKLHKAYKNTKK